MIVQSIYYDVKRDLAVDFEVIGSIRGVVDEAEEAVLVRGL